MECQNVNQAQPVVPSVTHAVTMLTAHVKTKFRKLVLNNKDQTFTIYPSNVDLLKEASLILPPDSFKALAVYFSMIEISDASVVAKMGPDAVKKSGSEVPFYIEWESGVWNKGVWLGGTWKTGLWHTGTWLTGVWKGGKWESGVWRFGVWEDGEWFNGIWYNGFWKNGVWYNGTWCDGVWYDGTWIDGKWIAGTLHNMRIDKVREAQNQDEKH